MGWEPGTLREKHFYDNGMLLLTDSVRMVFCFSMLCFTLLSFSCAKSFRCSNSLNLRFRDCETFDGNDQK